MLARPSNVSRAASQLALGLALALAAAMPAHAACGDGVVDGAEQCDDGNVAPGDGCDPACQIALGDCPTGMTGLWKFDDDPDTSVRSLSIIDHLDGTLDYLFFFEGQYSPGTGTRSGTDAHLSSSMTWMPCNRLTTMFGFSMTRVSTTVCGDDQQTGGEACEDGDWESGDGCDINCTPTACGNAVVTTGEQCDDGNVLPGDGCNKFCHLRECGDGELTPGQLVTCSSGPSGTCGPDLCDAGWSTPFSMTPFFEGEANSVLADGDDYYFGGYFFQGGFASIARWSNGSWTSVGSGFADENQVYSLARLGSDIYAGGDLTGVRGSGIVLSGIARWDGSSWSNVGGGVHRTGVNASVGTMLTSGSDLYVTGYFDEAGSVPANGIARWDGSSWHALGDLLQSGGDPGWGNALTQIGSDIYVGGTFETAGGVAALNVARWDGTSWSAVGAGLPHPVLSLATDGTKLYAATFPAVMQWDGSQWTALWDYSVDLEPEDPFSGITNVVTLGGNLFATAEKIEEGWGIARWDGSAWTPLGSGIRKEEELAPTPMRVDAVGVDGNRLIIVGQDFDTAGGRPAPDIVVWTEGTCGEKCDDGNVTSGDGCDSDCSVTACGNGIESPDEDCDDANQANGDGCDTNCTDTACGNGIATAGETCDDGNAVAGDGCESDCRITTVTENAAPGGTVSSPPATESFPVQLEVTSPGGGSVSIGEAATPETPSGYSVLGTVLDISAPPASVASPLTITITVHESAIPPGYEPEDIAVSRDGVAIDECSGTPGQASPDPCVDARLVAGDTVEITVLTSHASQWAALGRGMGDAEQGCVLAATESATRVTTTYIKSAAKCLKVAQADKGELAECLAVRAVAKAGKAMQKTIKSLAKCPAGVPFGFPDTTDANLASLAGGQQLVADVLGDDIVAVIDALPEGDACRSAAIGAISKVVASKVDVFLECERAGFAAAGTPFVSSRDIGACLDAVIEDANDTVAKAIAAFTKKLASKCVPASLLSGECGLTANSISCLEDRIDCRLCSMMGTISGFEQGCDVYDDGVSNGSCR